MEVWKLRGLEAWPPPNTVNRKDARGGANRFGLHRSLCGSAADRDRRPPFRALSRSSRLFGAGKWRASAPSPKRGVRSPPCSLRPPGRTCALRTRTARPCAVLCVLGVLSRGRFGPLGLHGNFQKHTGSPSLCCSVYPSVNLCDLQTHWQSFVFLCGPSCSL